MTAKGFFRECCFCGKPPVNGDKEDIVPRWLSIFSKKDKHPANLYIHGKLENIPFKGMRFPSCGNCNREWSKLENRVKSIFLEIEKGQLPARNVVYLLDWLDKFRISNWLYMKARHKDVFPKPPTFRVNDRVGQADRIVVISRLPQSVGNGIGLLGLTIGQHPNDHFMHMPSCLGIVVKNIALISCSNAGLLVHLLGYGKLESSTENGLEHGQISLNFSALRNNERRAFPKLTFMKSIALGQILTPQIHAASTLDTSILDLSTDRKFSDNEIIAIPDVGNVDPDMAYYSWASDVYSMQRNVSRLYAGKFLGHNDGHYRRQQLELSDMVNLCQDMASQKSFYRVPTSETWKNKFMS